MRLEQMIVDCLSLTSRQSRRMQRQFNRVTKQLPDSGVKTAIKKVDETLPNKPPKLFKWGGGEYDAVFADKEVAKQFGITNITYSKRVNPPQDDDILAVRPFSVRSGAENIPKLQVHVPGWQLGETLFSHETPDIKLSALNMDVGVQVAQSKNELLAAQKQMQHPKLWDILSKEPDELFEGEDAAQLMQVMQHVQDLTKAGVDLEGMRQLCLSEALQTAQRMKHVHQWLPKSERAGNLEAYQQQLQRIREIQTFDIQGGLSSSYS